LHRDDVVIAVHHPTRPLLLSGTSGVGGVPSFCPRGAQTPAYLFGHSVAAAENDPSPRQSLGVRDGSLVITGHARDHDVDVLPLVRRANARPPQVLRILQDSLLAGVMGRPIQSELIDAAMNGETLGWAPTVEQLRAEYGERQRWWGDLSHAETRALYHALLPTSLLEEDASEYSLPERAELAMAARRAARLYARERAMLPFAIGSELLDGVRQLVKNGSFQTAGYSDEQLWKKYAGCLPSELPEGAEFHPEVYLKIVEKACSTNRHIDQLCGACVEVAPTVAEAASRVADAVRF